MADKNGFSSGDEVMIIEGFFEGCVGHLISPIENDKYVFCFGDFRHEIIHKDMIRRIANARR